MTIPPGLRSATKRVSDILRELMPQSRQVMSGDERMVATYLRGNDNLLQGLKGILESRLEGRASLPTPSDPLECMRRIAMDKELRWVLAKLEFIFRSPVSEASEIDDGEQPM